MSRKKIVMILLSGIIIGILIHGAVMDNSSGGDKLDKDRIQNSAGEQICGMWRFYGSLEKDSGGEPDIANVIRGKDFEETYGTDPDDIAPLEIDENGLTSIYEALPDTDTYEWQIISDKEYVQHLVIGTLDGKKLDDPITQVTSFTIISKYLFVEVSYPDNPEVDPGNIQVYEKETS